MGTVSPIREIGEPSPYLAPPYNTEAEQALLGALLISNLAYDRVIDFLRPGDFGNAVHAKIFSAIGLLIDKAQAANPVTLKSLFDQDGSLSEIGGFQYLVRLAETAVTVINAEDYAHIIADLSRRRAIMAVCQDTLRDAARIDIERSAAEVLDDCDRALLAISERAESRALSIASALDQAIGAAERVYQADGRVIGVTTGLVDLDRKLGGLHNGDLTIIAARPAQGKSALAMTIAHAAARSGVPTMFFSLEMTAPQLAARQIAAVADVSADQQRSGPLSREDIRAIIAARSELADLPLTIDDDPSATLAAIRSRCRRQKRRNKLGLVIVDYIGLMPSDKRAENRVQEISAITRGLKGLAKDLNIPVLALSQLNRGVESRDDKRPILADLRESGSIEQDSDNIIFLYREEVYVRMAEPQRRANDTNDGFEARYGQWQSHLDRVSGIADLLVRKNRFGPVCNVRAHFNGRRTAFENLAFR